MKNKSILTVVEPGKFTVEVRKSKPHPRPPPLPSSFLWFPPPLHFTPTSKSQGSPQPCSSGFHWRLPKGAGAHAYLVGFIRSRGLGSEALLLHPGLIPPARPLFLRKPQQRILENQTVVFFKRCFHEFHFQLTRRGFTKSLAAPSSLPFQKELKMISHSRV